jgi:hypothetical protein
VRMPARLFETLDALIAAKAREDDRPTGADPPPGTANPGTLAAARQWQNRELCVQMFEKTAADLGLTKDELAKYWKSRRVAEPRTASYGAGSFVVVKRKRPAESDGREHPQPESAKPMTDEEWWSAADASARGAWLTANFVEASSIFEVLRADQAECADCGGRGFLDRAQSAVCTTCGGCGSIRTLTYR